MNALKIWIIFVLIESLHNFQNTHPRKRINIVKIDLIRNLKKTTRNRHKNESRTLWQRINIRTTTTKIDTMIVLLIIRSTTVIVSLNKGDYKKKEKKNTKHLKTSRGASQILRAKSEKHETSRFSLNINIINIMYIIYSFVLALRVFDVRLTIIIIMIIITVLYNLQRDGIEINLNNKNNRNKYYDMS